LESGILRDRQERWDGSGYPRGLRGEEIPECGRIVMLVDHYDALRTSRPYKPALTHERACQIMLEGNGRTYPQHFNPRLLAIFREAHRDFEAIYERHRD
jgi:putative two-component system response regulator